MNMIDKRTLSQRSGKLALIQEGLFLRCYDQSLFSLVQFFYPELKVCGKSFKNCQGETVLYGGFPKSKSQSLFSSVQLHETEWGMEIECDVVNESAYQTWRQQHLVHIENGVNNKNVKDIAKASGKSIQLSEAECRFLSQWEPGRFPVSVDTGFIQGLKSAWALY